MTNSAEVRGQRLGDIGAQDLEFVESALVKEVLHDVPDLCRSCK